LEEKRAPPLFLFWDKKASYYFGGRGREGAFSPSYPLVHGLFVTPKGKGRKRGRGVTVTLIETGAVFLVKGRRKRAKTHQPSPQMN